MTSSQDHCDRKILQQLSLRQAANIDEIKRAEALLEIAFPSDYVGFLQTTNGIEGWIGESYVRLWNVEELFDLNARYDRKDTPEFVIIGSDGGSEAYGFDGRTAALPVVMVPFIPMVWEEAIPMGQSFNEFLERLYNQK